MTEQMQCYTGKKCGEINTQLPLSADWYYDAGHGRTAKNNYTQKKDTEWPTDFTLNDKIFVWLTCHIKHAL